MIRDDCTFLYFVPTGEWKYVGRGVFPDTDEVTRQTIMKTNGGNMPGLAQENKAEHLTIIVFPDEDCQARFAYPRMLKEMINERRPGLSRNGARRST